MWVPSLDSKLRSHIPGSTGKKHTHTHTHTKQLKPEHNRTGKSSITFTHPIALIIKRYGSDMRSDSLETNLASIRVYHMAPREPQVSSSGSVIHSGSDSGTAVYVRGVVG